MIRKTDCYNREKIGMSLLFASIIHPTETSQKNGYLLASSLREFGGLMAKNPVCYYVPNTESSLNESIENKLRKLDVEIIQFDADSLDLGFPFLGHAYAASLAEKEADKRGQNIAWLAPNSIILREPTEMKLDAKYLGYRPVHHKLIGSEFNKPKDEFWSIVYEFCRITDDDAFPMKTHVDAEVIRPYFNAGFLIVDPKKEILQQWYDQYSRAYLNDQFAKFYEIDDIYRIFIHQAILSGVTLKLAKREEMVELGAKYNYPLHLFNDDITPQKPQQIEDCITIRHEGFYNSSNWEEQMPASSNLKNWLARRISEIQ